MESLPEPWLQRGWTKLRHLDWSRALQSIVHGGMVVGMVLFIIIDLLATSGRFYLWYTVLAAAGMVALVLATLNNPLTGLLVASAFSLAVTIGGTILRAVLGFSFPSFGLTEVAAISILASEVARVTRPGRAAFGLSVAVAVTGVAALRSPGPVGLVAVFWLTLTLAVVAGLSRRWAERSREMSEDAVRQDERLAIARELHDTVAHHVTGIVVQAQAAQAVGTKDPDAVRHALMRIEESGIATMNAMRRLVGALRQEKPGEPLAPVSGLDEMEEMARAAADRDGYELALRIDRDVVPASYESSIYRIIQEGLTNIGRHGRDVSKVEVIVEAQDDGIHVSVVDDGKHHDRSGERGFGLTGMAERLSALGGQFWAGQRPLRGWSVTAWIPTGE